MKYAVYADQVTEVRSSDQSWSGLNLTLYHETRGAQPYDHEFALERDKDTANFRLTVQTPSWLDRTRYYGNALSIFLLNEQPRIVGHLAVSGCLGPWLSENDHFANTDNIVAAVCDELTVATALPGLPFSEDWVPDAAAREAAYVAGRIPESERAWR